MSFRLAIDQGTKEELVVRQDWFNTNTYYGIAFKQEVFSIRKYSPSIFTIGEGFTGRITRASWANYEASTPISYWESSAQSSFYGDGRAHGASLSNTISSRPARIRGERVADSHELHVREHRRELERREEQSRRDQEEADRRRNNPTMWERLTGRNR